MLLANSVVIKDKSVLTLIKFLIIPFLIINLLACVQQSTQPGNSVTVCVFPNKQVAPGWICGEPVSGLDLQAVGVADKSVAGFNYMQDIAEIAAVKNLTELLKAKVAKTVIQYLTLIEVESAGAIKAGASTINTISIQTLNVAKQYKSQTGPEGRVFVLVGLDKDTSNTILLNAVKTSMKIDHALWQKFQIKKSFDEMARGIAAMGD